MTTHNEKTKWKGGGNMRRKAEKGWEEVNNRGEMGKKYEEGSPNYENTL